MSAAARPRVVIVGGGFGGLFAAKFLRRAAVDITLVERTNHHLFQPLLYQVATGILSPGAVAPPLREVLKRHDNVKVELGEVTGFDLGARTVDFKGIRVAGFVGWVTWAFIHLTFLTGFKNRFLAGIRWVLSFVGRCPHRRTLGWDRTRATFASAEARPPPNHS